MSKKLIQYFLEVEEMAEATRAKAYAARVELERLYAPAPSGASKKKFTVTQQVDLKAKFRKRLIKINNG